MQYMPASAFSLDCRLLFLLCVCVFFFSFGTLKQLKEHFTQWLVLFITYLLHMCHSPVPKTGSHAMVPCFGLERCGDKCRPEQKPGAGNEFPDLQDGEC